MIQTSYFANYRNFPKNKKKISISRFTPKWFEEDHNALELAPSKELLLETKDGLVSDEEYTIRYKKETLSKLDPLEIYKKYNNSIFLCYETTEDFCHRNIVSEWLMDNGLLSEELIDNPSINIIIDNEFTDYPYFEKIIGRLLSNYNNPQIIGDKNSFSEDFSLSKEVVFSIKESLFQDFDITIIFSKNGKEDISKINGKVYIINYTDKKIN